MAGTGTTGDCVWGSVTDERDKAFMAAVALHLHSNLEQEGETAMGTQSTAAEGRFELEEKYRRWKETHLPAGDAFATYPLDKQLEALGDERLIGDAPLKLWLKRLDSKVLVDLHNKYVGLCAKNKLLSRRDETAYRTNRLREATHRELEYRRTKPSDGEDPALGSQTQQSGTERLHRTVPKGRRQTRSQPVER